MVFSSLTCLFVWLLWRWPGEGKGRPGRDRKSSSALGKRERDPRIFAQTQKANIKGTTDICCLGGADRCIIWLFLAGALGKALLPFAVVIGLVIAAATQQVRAEQGFLQRNEGRRLLVCGPMTHQREREERKSFFFTLSSVKKPERKQQQC
ncbi:hypothetical protein R1flu_006446 [Riccia fluitans]|uniref:Uncharacterized protein n=1 Tax=Riccia fluitans TaxID=41844 RepID=A0ABD1YW19_9MARC